MSENTFDPQEINLQFQPLPAFIDSDGAFKLNTPMLSSFNFDGSIPKFDGNIDAIDIKPGYLIQTEVGGQYYPVVSVESDDPAIESTGLVTINYIDESGNTISEEYSETDQVAVVYENWSEKILGSQGWGITAEGNAIFTNVAVRGRIEATEGEISGNLIVNGGLLTSETASSTGGIILNNSGFTSYDSSGTQTFNIDADTGAVTIGSFDPTLDYATQSELNGKIDDGGAAGDIVSYNTKITGGNIETGKIRSTGYNGPGTGSAFSTAGMQINLDDGTIASKEFRIDSSGNAFFKGSLDAADGTFSGTLSAGISITSPIINGGTITGTNINSATSGQRVQIQSSQAYFYGPNAYGGTIYGGDSALLVDGSTSLYLSSPNIYFSNTFFSTLPRVRNSRFEGDGSGITNIPGSSISGNIGGNAANITSFNINQNVGTGNNVTFNSISALSGQGAGQGTHYLHWNSSGGTVTRSTSLPSGSSRELKDEITSFPVDIEWTRGITDLYTFKYKSDINDFGSASAPTQLGIIIDEIIDIDEIKPLIFEVNDTKAFDYTKVGVLLIPVINSLLEKIDNLQNRVLQLESQLGG